MGDFKGRIVANRAKMPSIFILPTETVHALSTDPIIAQSLRATCRHFRDVLAPTEFARIIAKDKVMRDGVPTTFLWAAKWGHENVLRKLASLLPRDEATCQSALIQADRFQHLSCIAFLESLSPAIYARHPLFGVEVRMDRCLTRDQPELLLHLFATADVSDLSFTLLSKVALKAGASGWVDVLESLFEHLDSHVWEIRPAFKKALEQGHYECVKVIISRIPDIVRWSNDVTALVLLGNIAGVKQLLRHAPSTDIVFQYEETSMALGVLVKLREWEIIQRVLWRMERRIHVAEDPDFDLLMLQEFMTHDQLVCFERYIGLGNCGSKSGSFRLLYDIVHEGNEEALDIVVESNAWSDDESFAPTYRALIRSTLSSADLESFSMLLRYMPPDVEATFVDGDITEVLFRAAMLGDEALDIISDREAFSQRLLPAMGGCIYGLLKHHAHEAIFRLLAHYPSGVFAQVFFMNVIQLGKDMEVHLRRLWEGMRCKRFRIASVAATVTCLGKAESFDAARLLIRSRNERLEFDVLERQQLLHFATTLGEDALELILSEVRWEKHLFDADVVMCIWKFVKQGLYEAANRLFARHKDVAKLLRYLVTLQELTGDSDDVDLMWEWFETTTKDDVDLFLRECHTLIFYFLSKENFETATDMMRKMNRAASSSTTHAHFSFLQWDTLILYFATASRDQKASLRFARCLLEYDVLWAECRLGQLREGLRSSLEVENTVQVKSLLWKAGGLICNLKMNGV